MLIAVHFDFADCPPQKKNIRVTFDGRIYSTAQNIMIRTIMFPDKLKLNPSPHEYKTIVQEENKAHHTNTVVLVKQIHTQISYWVSPEFKIQNFDKTFTTDSLVSRSKTSEL